MSLIVLNSRGQDPAEFENHGLNLKLGQETQFCLCGANLNRCPRASDNITITTGANNGWVVGNGESKVSAEVVYSPQVYSIREGVYNVAQLADEMSAAMGGAYGQTDDKYNNQKISTWRKTDVAPVGSGLWCDESAIPVKMSLKCSQCKILNGVCSRTDRVLGALGGNPYHPAGTPAPNGIPTLETDIADNAVNALYTSLTPSVGCKNFIDTDPLWNTGNSARLTTFSAAGAPDPGGSDDGWFWAIDLPAGFDGRSVVDKFRGGVVSSKWCSAAQSGTGGPASGTNTLAPLGANMEWGMNGNRFDLWWEVNPRTTAANIQVDFYSTDIRKSPLTRSSAASDTKVGSLVIPTPVGAETWEISMRPVSTNGGGAIVSYKIECYARQRTAMGGNFVGAAIQATGGAAPGFYQINGTDQALYNYLPIFQAVSYREDVPAGPFVINIAAIKHNTTPNKNGFPATASLVANTPVAAVDNALEISCAFSPLHPNNMYNSIITQQLRGDMNDLSKRYASIGSSIGFEVGTIQEMAQATTSSIGVEGTNDSTYWEGSDVVAVVQLPNIPLHGELGAGSTVWGGSNGGRVLGVVSLRDDETKYSLGMNAYTEPSLENWIDVGNMGCDALNQLKVKLTDAQGRKLIGLYPDSTIWLKVRSKQQGDMRTGGNDFRGTEYR